VVSAQTRQFLRAGSIGFVLGYERGTLAGHARVAGFVVASGFDPATGGPPGADWALLTLEAPPGAPALGRVLPLAPEVPGAGAPVALAGYQQDRWEVLLADLGCRVSGAERDRAGLALLRHTCAATRGSDGGPLLARAAGGEWVVVGVAVRASIGRAADTGGFAGAAGGLAVPAAAIDLSAAVPPA
jgi:protease YdgD